MNRILCPVDFSDASLTALEYATEIAEKHGSSLKIVHVITSNEYNEKLVESGDEAFQQIREEIGTKLGVISLEINDASQHDYDICTQEILYGDFTDRIAETIEKENISLVVMGTYGAKDVNEARMGSNTVKVMDKSKIPVLSIPANAGYQNFDRVVYGSELDDEDKLMLQQVVNFLVPYDSHLYLVHVTENPDKDKEVYKKYTEEIKSYINYKKLDVEEFATHEDVGIALEHSMNVHDAHLLVLVHKNRNLLSNLFHRSLTKRMSYLTNFPLLALRN
ncbi:MAG: universal stress protein [Saprospiraceae bacterium]|nr:universal stress protein [Saprospiraceae bacterium]